MIVYCIQQVINESSPHDCVGKKEAFITAELRDEALKQKESNEYYDYYAFDLPVQEA